MNGVWSSGGRGEGGFQPSLQLVHSTFPALEEANDRLPIPVLLPLPGTPHTLGKARATKPIVQGKGL